MLAQKSTCSRRHATRNCFFNLFVEGLMVIANGTRFAIFSDDDCRNRRDALPTQVRSGWTDLSLSTLSLLLNHGGRDTPRELLSSSSKWLMERVPVQKASSLSSPRASNNGRTSWLFFLCNDRDKEREIFSAGNARFAHTTHTSPRVKPRKSSSLEILINEKVFPLTCP